MNSATNGIYTYRAKFQPYQDVPALHLGTGIAQLEYDPPRSAYRVSIVLLVCASDDSSPLTGSHLDGWLEAGQEGVISEGDVISLTYGRRLGRAYSALPSNPDGVNRYTITAVRRAADGAVDELVASFHSTKTQGSISLKKARGRES